MCRSRLVSTIQYLKYLKSENGLFETRVAANQRSGRVFHVWNPQLDDMAVNIAQRAVELTPKLQHIEQCLQFLLDVDISVRQVHLTMINTVRMLIRDLQKFEVDDSYHAFMYRQFAAWMEEIVECATAIRHPSPKRKLNMILKQDDIVYACVQEFVRFHIDDDVCPDVRHLTECKLKPAASAPMSTSVVGPVGMAPMFSMGPRHDVEHVSVSVLELELEPVGAKMAVPAPAPAKSSSCCVTG